MSQQLDTQGEAHDALGSAVSSYGQRVLNDPHILGNLVTDLLPDLPRERNLLVMGAEAGVAGEISQHVEEQHIDPDTAVQLAARSLSERRSIDPAASMWVASEYAQALGYRVRPPAESAPVTPPPVPSGPPTMTAVAGMPPVPTTPQSQEPQWPGAPGSAPPQGPPPSQWPSWPNPQQPQPGQSWPPNQPAGGYQPSAGGGYQPAGGGYQPPAGGGYQPAGGGYQPPAGGGYQAPAGGGYQPPAGGGYQPAVGYRQSSRSGRKTGIAIGGAVLAVVVVFLIVAAAAHIAPFSKTSATPTPTLTPTHRVTPPVHTHSATPTVTPTVTPTLAAGITPLLQLLPSDIADPTTQCTAVTKPDWKSPGLVSGLQCDDPGVPNGSVSAYQLDSNKDYTTTWANFNSWSSFSASTAGSNCPPSASGAQGLTPWNSKAGFPTKQGQVLECWTGSNAAPIYVWTLPTQDAFIVAVGADGSTFKALDAWWRSDASSPANAPTATPSPQSS